MNPSMMTTHLAVMIRLEMTDMTSPLTKDARAILRRSKALKVTNSMIGRDARFIEFVVLQDWLQGQLDAGWKELADSMEEHGIDKIDGDWGYIQFVERRTLKGKPTPSFSKPVIDTSKVRAYETLAGKLPPGITETISRSLRKSIKAVV